MSTTLGRTFVCALVAAALAAPAARADEVEGDLVCCKKKCNSCSPAPVTACFDSRCDPCRVGPIRRFFRGCHRKPCCKPCAPPCPPPCPPALAIGAPVFPAPVVPAPVVPAPAAPFAPPASIGTPTPPGPPVFPGSGSALRRSGTLTPPAPPPPVRADRIASTAPATITRGKIDTSVQITLVSAEKRNQAQRATTDDAGRFRTSLSAGTWHVYAKASDGRQVYRGKLEVHEAGLITVRMR